MINLKSRLIEIEKIVHALNEREVSLAKLSTCIQPKTASIITVAHGSKPNETNRLESNSAG